MQLLYHIVANEWINLRRVYYSTVLLQVRYETIFRY
jgi:hypothetical protein